MLPRRYYTDEFHCASEEVAAELAKDIGAQVHRGFAAGAVGASVAALGGLLIGLGVTQLRIMILKRKIRNFPIHAIEEIRVEEDP